MDELTQATAPSYDPALAVHLGQFINVAYAMYDQHPSNPTPPPPSSFLAGYEFVAWVQMKDFIITEGNWTFYGLLAKNESKANEYVLAIRGTGDLTEWWDDLTSIVLVSMPNFGEVGYGFNRIYQTLRIVYQVHKAAPWTAAESLEAAGTFSDQVAAAVRRHAIESVGADADATMSVMVTGHSLGSALATLYVAENALTQKVQTPLICTLASPRVGDPTFAAKFNGLGIASWRIVNELDVVPKVPYFGFQHVATEHLYNSGSSTVWSLECWHSIDTYLHLLDPKEPLLPTCVWPPPQLAAAALLQRRMPTQAEKEIVISAPAQGGTTINITIKIG